MASCEAIPSAGLAMETLEEVDGTMKYLGLLKLPELGEQYVMIQMRNAGAKWEPTVIWVSTEEAETLYAHFPQKLRPFC